MEPLGLNIQVQSNLYIKNPDSSALGREILAKSIELINQIGFESFTFKKLSQVIQSTESSIYRYFKSKHSLLIYLTSWYWMWVDYKIVMATTNIDDANTRLNKAITVLTQPLKKDNFTSSINIEWLDRIIINESIKAYHTVDVDSENKKGFFQAYKNVVNRVAQLVQDVNSSFPFPHMLVSTVIEGAHQQRFFSEHLPNLTDADKTDAITQFYHQMVLKMLA